jgi:PqqD family protein of HPr-rel-A system
VTFRAPPDGVLRCIRLDSMTAIYDRRANATHVVAEVVPAILDVLREGAADLDALALRLDTDERDALAERLAELVETGLIEQT